MTASLSGRGYPRASRRRLLSRVVPGVLGIILLLGGVLAAPANAAPDSSSVAKPGTGSSSTFSNPKALEFLRFTNFQTVRCLDSNAQGNVYTLGCNGGPYQTWASYGNGPLIDLATNLCLDSNAAGHVYTLPCNGGNYQKWYPRNRVEIVNLATGRCLDSNYQGHVYTLGCNGGNYQKWVWN